MPINPNIAMSFKPVEIQQADPLRDYAAVAQIQNAQLQNQLARQQMEQEQGVMNYLRATDLSTPEGRAGLRRFGKTGLGYEKLIAEQEANALKRQELEGKLREQRMTALGTGLTSVLQDPSDASLTAAFDRLDATGVDTKPFRQSLLSEPDLSKRQAVITQYVTSNPEGRQALAFVQPKVTEVKRADGSIVFLDTNPNSPTFKQEVMPAQATGMTPYQTQSLGIQRGQLGVSQGQLKVAQDRLAAESESGNYSPETIQYLATQYNLTGQLPTLGIGKKAGAVKMQILEEARKIGTAAPTDGSAAPTPQQAAENVVQNKQTRAVEQSTLRAFSAGPEGRSVRSFNTAVDHLDTMSKLATALENNDIRVFNTVANAFAKGVGVAAPTNFDTAKSIVGGEVAKALAGSSMALKDREEIRDTISRANSPAQLAGSVRTLQELMGGQLKSLKQQYQTGTNRKDFDAKLSPRARQVVSELEGQQPAATGPVKISGDADYDKLPSGAIFIGPDGQQRRKP